MSDDNSDFQKFLIHHNYNVRHESMKLALSSMPIGGVRQLSDLMARVTTIHQFLTNSNTNPEEGSRQANGASG